MKNLSPRQIALLSSGGISLVVLLLLLAVRLLAPSAVGWQLVVFIPIAVFASAYLLTFLSFDKFVYKKIKLIYNSISTLKASRKNESGKVSFMKKDIIEELEKEVMELANKQTKEIEALKELAQYRKEFLGNVSHELKTPIFNIQGYLHTLIDGGMDDPEVNKKFLVKASENLERLGHIVHDLEVISQIETNSLTLDFTRFNIVDLVEEVFDDLEMKAEQREIQLKFENGADTSIMVKGDRESIRQVLINLISNSIRYGKPNGATTVSIKDQDDNVLVEVADNGIGIAENHLPRIFERFYRVDKSRSRELGGTGLGLSIVKHILEAHGQTISVESTPGKGSKFGFTLKKG